MEGVQHHSGEMLPSWEMGTRQAGRKVEKKTVAAGVPAAVDAELGPWRLSIVD